MASLEVQMKLAALKTIKSKDHKMTAWGAIPGASPFFRSFCYCCMGNVDVKRSVDGVWFCMKSICLSEKCQQA